MDHGNNTIRDIFRNTHIPPNRCIRANHAISFITYSLSGRHAKTVGANTWLQNRATVNFTFPVLGVRDYSENMGLTKNANCQLSNVIGNGSSRKHNGGYPLGSKKTPRVAKACSFT